MMSASFKKKILIIMCKAFHRICHVLPLKDQAVFSSFNGAYYNDNPKAISEQLHKINPKIKIIWMLPNNYDYEVPSYIISVPRYSLYALYYYATSKIIIDNFSIPQWFVKRNGQKYIQTWHGDRGFKKILYDASGILRPEKRICDLMVAGSELGYKKLRSAFRYEGEILKVGSPRNDILIHPDVALIQKIKNSLSIDSHTKVILYAPTYRRNQNTGFLIKGLNITELLNSLESITSTKWNMIVRAHKASKGFTNEFLDNRIIDATSYPEMNELMLISDLLITDYSSSAGDFPLTNKPVIYVMCTI